MIKVERIHPNYVAQVWPHIEHFIEPVAEFNNGDWTVDQLRADVLTGRMSLAVSTDGDKFVGTLVYFSSNRRNARVAFVTAIGGGFVVDQDHWTQMTSIWKSEGVTAVEGAVRKSVMRLLGRLGFKEKYSVIGVTL